MYFYFYFSFIFCLVPTAECRLPNMRRKNFLKSIVCYWILCWLTVSKSTYVTSTELFMISIQCNGNDTQNIMIQKEKWKNWKCNKRKKIYLLSDSTQQRTTLTWHILYMIFHCIESKFLSKLRRKWHKNRIIWFL